MIFYILFVPISNETMVTKINFNFYGDLKELVPRIKNSEESRLRVPWEKTCLQETEQKRGESIPEVKKSDAQSRYTSE